MPTCCGSVSDIKHSSWDNFLLKLSLQANLCSIPDLKSTRTLSIFLIFFLLILLIFFYLLIIDRNPSELPSTLLDKNVPIFETDSLLKDEKFISSKEIGNKITLINFFSSWCKPCREEHIFIKRLSNKENIILVIWSHGSKGEQTLDNCSKAWNKVPPVILQLHDQKIKNLQIKLYKLFKGNW